MPLLADISSTKRTIRLTFALPHAPERRFPRLWLKLPSLITGELCPEGKDDQSGPWPLSVLRMLAEVRYYHVQNLLVLHFAGNAEEGLRLHRMGNAI